MKTFISYASEDLKTATRLYRDLAGAGVELFRYGATETIGIPTWTEILTWISGCDTFMVLISRHSLRSRPVQEEIEQAHYRFIKSDGRQPSRIVSVLLDAGSQPPMIIERFSKLDFTDYTAGLSRLLDQLGLKPRRAQATSAKAPVVDASPAPARAAEAHEWSVGAERLLANYQKLKPADLAEKEETEHVNALLAAYTGKQPTTFATPQTLARADAKFRGVERSEAASPLSDLLLRYDPSRSNEKLAAPTLRTTPHGMRHEITWNPIPGATGYVLESSILAGFESPVEAYAGTGTSHLVGPLLLGAHYRVRAKGGVFRRDSDWSAPITVGGATRSLVSGTPVLKAARAFRNVDLKWSAVSGATDYVLEHSIQLGSGAGLAWRQVYRGTERSFTHELAAGISYLTNRYRVKAVLAHGDGPWSAVVTA